MPAKSVTTTICLPNRLLENTGPCFCTLRIGRAARQPYEHTRRFARTLRQPGRAGDAQKQAFPSAACASRAPHGSPKRCTRTRLVQHRSDCAASRASFLKPIHSTQHPASHGLYSHTAHYTRQASSCLQSQDRLCTQVHATVGGGELRVHPGAQDSHCGAYPRPQQQPAHPLPFQALVCKASQAGPAPLVRPGQVVALELRGLRPGQQAPLAGRLGQVRRRRGRRQARNLRRSGRSRLQAPPGLPGCGAPAMPAPRAQGTEHGSARGSGTYAESPGRQQCPYTRCPTFSGPAFSDHAQHEPVRPWAARGLLEALAQGRRRCASTAADTSCAGRCGQVHRAQLQPFKCSPLPFQANSRCRILPVLPMVREVHHSWPFGVGQTSPQPCLLNSVASKTVAKPGDMACNCTA